MKKIVEEICLDSEFPCQGFSGKVSLHSSIAQRSNITRNIQSNVVTNNRNKVEQNKVK